MAAGKTYNLAYRLVFYMKRGDIMRKKVLIIDDDLEVCQ